MNEGPRFESIDDEYYSGVYQDVELIIMKENGYVEATSLCADGGKRYDLWVRNKSTIKLIESMSAPPIINDNDNETAYIHPTMLPHLALWISPQHMHITNKIMEEYNIFRDREAYAQLPWVQRILVKTIVIFRTLWM